MSHARVQGSRYRTQATFVKNAVLQPMNCSAKRKPTGYSRWKYRVLQAASASCIAIAGDGRPLLSGRSLHLASSRVVLDARIFPNHFELVPVQAEEFFTQIA